MKTDQKKTRNESLPHLQEKNDASELMRRLGFGVVLQEHENCDLIVTHPGCASILALEIEQSPRNVLRNLSRNFAQGCTSVLVICPDFYIAALVARRIAKSLPPELQARTALSTAGALRLVQPLRFAGNSTAQTTP